MPTVTVGDIVLLTSHEPKPFSIMWDSRSYRLEPEKPTPVPYEAAALWFGDSRASGAVQSIVDDKGIRSFVADRDSEIRRLRVKWGIIGGDETLLAEGTNGARIPDVSVQNLDGEEVAMVVHDPDGEMLATSPTVTQHQDLIAIVQRQQEQIAKLVEMVSASSATEAIQPPDERPADEIVDGEQGLGEGDLTPGPDGFPQPDADSSPTPPPPAPPGFTQGDGGTLA